MNLRVMGIDPGLATTGIGVIESSGGGWRLVHSATVRTSPAETLPQRLARIHEFVASAVRAHRPDVAALESVFVGRNVKSTVMMAHGRAAALLAVAAAGIPCTEYSPLEIKQSVVGKGRADKGQVQKMVGVILGAGSGVSSDHESDALACALAHVLRTQIAPLVAEALRKSPGAEGDDETRDLLQQALSRRRRRR